MKKPSETTDTYWILAIRKQGNYPATNPLTSGKWLVFADIKEIDELWFKIKDATEKGLLGKSSKVATSKPNPNAKDPNKKVICVYTYDIEDKVDVMRIRQELRNLGIVNKIHYKTDQKTREGQYQANGNTNISSYFE